MALLTDAPAILPKGPALESTGPQTIHTAPEGVYVELAAFSPGHPALILGASSGGATAALLLPLDEFFEDRVDTARRLWRALVRGAPVKPSGFSAQRRRRLKLVLRALDADLAGAGYRDIALALFGGRVPRGAAWRTHEIRSFTIRLVQDGRGLMRGGYLRLLRPGRRQR